jgi:hypothetical protein
MNKDFDWTGFKMGDFVVYCRNRNEIRRFLEECDKQGLKWASGDPATNYIPEHPRACIKCDDLRLYHARRNFYEQAGKKIIDYNPETLHEGIDIIESMLGEKFIDYLISDVLKYISRYKYNGDVTDLEKAAWYLNKAIEAYKEVVR